MRRVGGSAALAAASVVAVSVAAASISSAFAQPGQTEPEQTPPRPGDGASEVDPGTVDDPVAGRAWFAPTALTPPEGSLSISSTELLIVSGSWSPADTIQLSANVLLPLVLDDEGFAGTAGLKLRLLSSGRLRVSAYGTLAFADSFDGDSDLIAGLIGGVASLCLDAGCHSVVSGFAAAAVARGDDSDLPVVVAASWVQRFHRNVKVVAELDGAATRGEIDELSSAAVLTAGLRLVARRWAVEIGAIGTIADGDFEPLPLPWISITARGGL